ncbi:lysophospholipid acyltransferase family protein [Brevibacterium sp. UMB1308A]|uniref:lysophospholipid acyltransferase family protein n=1 Tax=Brevibacterium sp. UMB1308A TaxID=3050608 RepID=UPI00254B6557|nr:lysophospholipid acyltransferase family protein [Brevibacterium sp. UMB1308A]MDK8346496.1 lysophospholipid acyltransferase family protein [Brevibacterium sp. UMB1308B]MDK8713659.1 lysophospholipid acyltransferase family protein [Brevibacterium sp. UMB1308A]
MTQNLSDVTFTPEDQKRTKRLARLVAPTLRASYRVFGRWVDENPHNIPKDGPAILAVYHASLLDPVFVALSLWSNGRLPRFMAKSSLFTGIIGRPMRALGQIPVLRDSATASDALKYARKALDAGECVVIYPQGTLTKNPELWPENFKTGAARLALESGVPIVPVAHWGTSALMPPGAKKPAFKPGNIVRINYGEPIDVTGIEPTRENLRAVTSHIEAVIARDVARLSGKPLPERYTHALELSL